jgi:hypothetical protein
MYEFMRECMFHVLFAPKVSLTQHDRTQLGSKSSRAALIAWKTNNAFVRVNLDASFLLNSLKHKNHGRA